MASVTKIEIWLELNNRGYIKKPQDPQIAKNTFHCDAKQCEKLLESEFELKSFGKSGYEVPRNVQMLVEAMNRSSTKNGDGSYNPIQEAKRRCYICIYRAYRNVYKRKSGQYPDIDVDDNFSNVNLKVKSASPMKPKSASPVKPKHASAAEILEASYFIKKILKDVNPAWVSLFAENFTFLDAFVKFALTKQRFIIVVPTNKVINHLFTKTKFTPKFMNVENLSNPDHPLSDLMSCSFGRVTKLLFDAKEEVIFHSTFYEQHFSNVVHIKATNGESTIDGVKIAQQTDYEYHNYHVTVLKITGILSDITINDRINNM